MDDQTIHKLEDLPLWKASEIRECGTPKNWGYCQGVKGYPREQWFIQFVDDEFHAHLYPIPTQVNAIIAWKEKWAREKVQTQIKQAIGF